METPDPNSHLEHLLIEMKESLEREIHSGLHDLRTEMRTGFAEVTARFDAQSVRLERHDIKKAEFERRVQKIEGPNPS